VPSQRHCEERSDEAIHLQGRCLEEMDCFAALAMTRKDQGHQEQKFFAELFFQKSDRLLRYLTAQVRVTTFRP